VVLKFGSSVLADRHCLPRVVHEIYRYCRRGHHVLAVSRRSAMTDRLLAEARYWSTPPAPELAVSELLAIGERREAQVGRFLEAVAAPLDEEERGALGADRGRCAGFAKVGPSTRQGLRARAEGWTA
jgi:aspartokinase